LTALRSIHQRRPETGGASWLDAYGSAIVLCPSCSFRLSSEESTLFVAFLKFPGLALLVRSECQPKTSVLGSERELAPMLCESAQRMLHEDNAGGSSRISEAMSFECLHRAFGAKLLKLEMELCYWPANGSITDYSISVDGVLLGVSVTRAMGKPGEELDEERATALLTKKLLGVVRSSETCMDKLQKQILHIWVRSSKDADTIERAYARLTPSLISSTVVLVTVCTLALLFEEKQKASPTRSMRTVKGAKDEAHLRVLQESDPMRCNRELSNNGYGSVVCPST